MTRAEFIQNFRERRDRHYREEVKNKRMRASEAAMGLADAEKDAIRLWRKHGKAYRQMTVKLVFQEQAKA